MERIKAVRSNDLDELLPIVVVIGANPELAG